MSKGNELQALLKRPGILSVPGVHDAITAKLARKAGFEAGYVSGSGAVTSILAQPDVGLITLPEMATHVRHISEATPVPLIVDADTGHGSVLNVMRCVRELESAGAAAIHIEDQEFPKRCGHLDGKTIVPLDEMVGKIRAAVGAKTDKSFQIIARTDARAVEGMEAAVNRAKAYVKAGADIIFPEALKNEEEFRSFAKALSAPLLANMTEFGKTPYYTAKQFESWGYKIVIFPVSALRIANRAVLDFFIALRQQGTQRDFEPKMLTRKELYEIIDYAEYEKRQDTYAPKESK